MVQNENGKHKAASTGVLFFFSSLNSHSCATNLYLLQITDAKGTLSEEYTPHTPAQVVARTLAFSPSMEKIMIEQTPPKKEKNFANSLEEGRLAFYCPKVPVKPWPFAAASARRKCYHP